MRAGVELAKRAGIVAIARGRGGALAVFGLNAEDCRVPESGFQIGGDRGEVRLRRHPMRRRRQHLRDEREDRQASGERRAKGVKALAAPCLRLAFRRSYPAQPKLPLPV